MKLWKESNKPNSAGTQVRMTVKSVASDIDRKVASRGVRVVNALRNAELNVLKGKRSGKRYRKYPDDSIYTASAPGEPPARRLGNLRLHWIGDVEQSRPTRNGSSFAAVLESGEEYADTLDKGTKDGRIKPRPFVDRIKEVAKPEIDRILHEPYA